MCDCIEKVRKVLSEKYDEVSLATKTVVNLRTGKFGQALPPLYFTYAVRGKDGKPTKQRRKSFIQLPFCPICGKKR